MNLSRRKQVYMTALALAVIGITAFVSSWILANKAAAIEKQLLQVHGESSVILIKDELEDLSKIVRDYAHWDDTYMYQQEGSPSYAAENFTPEVFKNLGINAMLYLDDSGRILSGVTLSKDSASVVPLRTDAARAFSGRYGEIISKYTGERKDINGLAVLEGVPSLVSMTPISDTAGENFYGALVFVTPLDEGLRLKIKEAIRCDVVYESPGNGSGYAVTYADELMRVSMGDFVSDGNEATARLIMTDILGAPVQGFKMINASDIWVLSRQFLVMIIVITCVSVGSIMMLQAWLNNILILNPIRKLGEFLNDISDYSKLREHPVFADQALRKEDSSVVGKIHGFLRRISEDTIKLQRDRLSTRLALDSSMAGTWEYEQKNQMIRVDMQVLKLLDLGLSTCKITREALLEEVHPDHRESLIRLFREYQNKEDSGFQMECQIRNKEGEYHWFLIKGDGLEWNSQGQCTLFSGIVLDIDQTKRLESELVHLSYHDKLTGLYNRRYFEEHLTEFDNRDNMPIAIFVADINGLKLANDAFGHERGDWLLKQAAACLKAAAGPDAVVSRWGGDEYAMMLPRTDDQQAGEIFRKIKVKCEEEGLHALSLHLALGYSIKSGGSLSLTHVIRSAEESMYRDKLLESRKAHSDFLEKFKAQLHEKGIETYEHCKRVATLGCAIGRRMALNDSMLQDITLLADLHDIGKIAMPEYLLTKTEELTGMEWALVRSHPEIGFRIVALMQDYAHLAQAVLSHHEWYDGSGYPRGLKAQDIPLIVRIVIVADAVDTMLSEQPYKIKMEMSDVIGELAGQKGLQFDPEVADHMIDILRTDPIAEELFIG